MIKRYALPRMERVWTDLYKKKAWLKVELAALWAKEQIGEAPTGIYDLAKKVRVTLKLLRRADEIEKVNDHDLDAFVQAVTELLDDPVKLYFHVGLTSFDTEDTALILVLRECLDLIIRKVERLIQVLLRRAGENKRTLQIGRTHFIHAEPITFGLKLLGWVEVLERHIKRLKDLKEEIGVGKFSGAVGTYALSPRIEELACAHLGLRPAKISTQILSRDIHVRYASILIGVANSLDRFATEIRHLAGTDIGEVAEFKKPGAKGSSAMPGKSMLRNPIKNENVCGLAKVARGYLIPALECEIVWNERSLDNSSAERIYIPDLTIVLDFMLQRFADTMEKLEVFPEQMEQNVWRTGGIVFAQRVMMKLTEKGMPRLDAYQLLEKMALSVRRLDFKTKEGFSFRDLVYQDPIIKAKLSQEELSECFNPQEALKNIDQIFARFGL